MGSEPGYLIHEVEAAPLFGKTPLSNPGTATTSHSEPFEP